MSGRVLVGEDDSSTRNLYTISLAGIPFDFALTGEELLDRVREIDYVLIITDFNYGRDRINGIDVARRLRGDGYKGPIILSTSDRKDKFTEGDLSLFDEYVEKPFNLMELSNKIRGYLE